MIDNAFLEELEIIIRKRAKKTYVRPDFNQILEQTNDNVVRINFLIDAEIIRKKEKKVLEYALNFLEDHEDVIAIINRHIENINGELKTIRELLPLPEFDIEFGTEKFPGA